MDAELAAGFAAVLASLIAIAIMVFASRRIIENIHRKNLASRQDAGPDGGDN